MEASAGNLILDFETLFSDFQELSNGSGLNTSRRTKFALVKSLDFSEFSSDFSDLKTL